MGCPFIPKLPSGVFRLPEKLDLTAEAKPKFRPRQFRSLDYDNPNPLAKTDAYIVIGEGVVYLTSFRERRIETQEFLKKESIE